MYVRLRSSEQLHISRRIHDDCRIVQTAAGSNTHYNVPFHVSPDFTGRDDILRRMDKLCLPNGPPHVQLVQMRFVLYGLGGSGKTQVCLKFAQDHRER